MHDNEWRLNAREREVSEPDLIQNIENTVRLITGSHSVDSVERWTVLRELVVPLLELDYWKRNVPPELESLFWKSLIDLESRDDNQYDKPLRLAPRYFSATEEVRGYADEATLLERLREPYQGLNTSQIVDLLSRGRGGIMERLDDMFVVGRGLVFSYEKVLENAARLPSQVSGRRRWCVGFQATGDRIKAFFGAHETSSLPRMANGMWDSDYFSQWLSEQIRGGRKADMLLPLHQDESPGAWYWNINLVSINKPLELLAALSQVKSYPELLSLVVEKERFITKPDVVVVSRLEDEKRQPSEPLPPVRPLSNYEVLMSKDFMLARDPRAQKMLLDGVPADEIIRRFAEEKKQKQIDDARDRVLYEIEERERWDPDFSRPSWIPTTHTDGEPRVSRRRYHEEHHETMHLESDGYSSDADFWEHLYKYFPPPRD